MGEHSRTVYCDQAHYGPVSGGGAEAEVKDVQTVVISVSIGNGGYLEGGLGGRMDRGSEEGRRDGYGDRLNHWEDNVANIILGTKLNAHLAYAMIL